MFCRVVKVNKEMLSRYTLGQGMQNDAHEAKGGPRAVAQAFLWTVGLCGYDALPPLESTGQYLKLPRTILEQLNMSR